MRFTVLASLALSAYAAPAPEIEKWSHVPPEYLSGFKNPTVGRSIGGKAVCVSGLVDVTATGMNNNINAPEPANQTVVTELVVESLQINTTLYERLVGGPVQVTGTWSIYSQLCFPKSGINDSLVQFTIHGGGFDHTYWDFAPGYSYIDAAVEQGYTVFSYDRLGNGLSDKPDPIQIVQTSYSTAVAHALIQKLRAGDFAKSTFKKVVGIGHSLGSYALYGITAEYPDDVDAAVLTSFSTTTSGLQLAFAGLDLSVAALNQPKRFADLPYGYLTANTIESVQHFFFRAPGFDYRLLQLSEAKKYFITLGEFLGIGGLPGPTKFKGPVDVVNGANDLPNCHGNCTVPINVAADVLQAYYPLREKSGSDWYLSAEAGHGLNLHYSAVTAYEHILGFFKKNGL